MKNTDDDYMKVLTDTKRCVGMVSLKPSMVKRSTYVGTFTVKALKEFLASLEAGYKPEHPVELHTLYSETGHAYILLASDTPEEMVRLAVIGCDNGVAGNG